jgi:hypothetical protein
VGAEVEGAALTHLTWRIENPESLSVLGAVSSVPLLVWGTLTTSLAASLIDTCESVLFFSFSFFLFWVFPLPSWCCDLR